jgi:SAM-dependent methyltransferase
MKIISCRNCSNHALHPILDLGLHPLADTYIYAEDTDYVESFAPLQLVQCGSCGSVQTGYSVSPEKRYRDYDYSYDSMNSTVAVRHFHDFADTINEQLRPHSAKQAPSVLEVGSNVGVMLQRLKTEGWNVLGIDPSSNICSIAKDVYHVDTINDFFGRDSALRIKKDHGKFDLVCGSNVFNHIDDLNGAFEAVTLLLKDDGNFVFEVPYLLSLFQQRAFDTIYHEHVHYHSVSSLRPLLNRFNLYITRVEIINYMCGSLRVTCRQNVSENCIKTLEMEDVEARSGILIADSWKTFGNRVKEFRHSLREAVAVKRQGGLRVVGIGAATKGNTLLNFCGLNHLDIDYIVDASPLKIGKLTPGSRIPILSDDVLRNDSGVAVLVLPWNITDFLKQKFRDCELHWIDLADGLRND